MLTVQFFHLYCMLKKFIIKCWEKYLSNVNNKERKERRKGHRKGGKEGKREAERKEGRKSSLETGQFISDTEMTSQT